MSLTTSCLVAAAAAVLTTTAQAAAPVRDALQPPSITVRFSDLDLTTPEGNTRLYRRLAHAAQLVCPPGQEKDLGDRARSQACQTEALQRAVRAIDSPMLARVAVDHRVSNN